MTPKEMQDLAGAIREVTGRLRGEGLGEDPSDEELEAVEALRSAAHGLVAIAGVILEG